MTDTATTAVLATVGAVAAAAGKADIITPEALAMVGGGIIFTFAGIMGRQMISDTRATRDAVLTANLPALRSDVDAVKQDVGVIRKEWDTHRQWHTEWREQVAPQIHEALQEMNRTIRDSQDAKPKARAKRTR
jgi:putative ubiquitin-RnfH superfamily antitoxin RatB of RatAB toxin-antitoxin module